MLVATTFLINSVFNFALGLLVARYLGPQGFGQFAIAAAAAGVLNTLFLDWIRLAATRFYSDHTRKNDPSVRGTLDLIFILSAFGTIAVSAIALLAGQDLGLSILLAAFVPAIAICNALFDYHSALTRARFDDRTYALLVILKNILSFTLMAGGAWWFQSPVMVACGLLISVLATLLVLRRRLIDPGVILLKPDWRAAAGYFAYAFPVILAAAVYFLIPLWNRMAIANSLGFAASGQFSLGYDMAIRIVQTIGSALDIILFQIVLKTNAENGADAAHARLRANMGIVVCGVLAVAAGYWLVLPSFEALLVPAAFQGTFAALTTILLPGLVCFAVLQAAVTPVFQLSQRTWPTVLAAVSGLACNAILTMRFGPGATLLDYAQAQAISYGVSLLVACVLALRIMRPVPSARDCLAVTIALCLMIALVWPLRAWPPGWLTLITSAAVGASAFTAVILAFNLGGCRALLRRPSSLPTA